MEPVSIGKILIWSGLAIAAIGVVLLAGPTLPLGRLPGDFHWKVGGMDVYVPFATCLLVSAVLSLVFWLIRR